MKKNRFTTYRYVHHVTMRHTAMGDMLLETTVTAENATLAAHRAVQAAVRSDAVGSVGWEVVKVHLAQPCTIVRNPSGRVESRCDLATLWGLKEKDKVSEIVLTHCLPGSKV